MQITWTITGALVFHCSGYKIILQTWVFKCRTLYANYQHYSLPWSSTVQVRIKNYTIHSSPQSQQQVAVAPPPPGWSGPVRSVWPVRPGLFRSGPFRSGPVRSRVLTQTGAGNRCSSWCLLSAQGSQGGMQPWQPVWTRKVEIFSSGFISWLLFKIRFIFYHVEQLNTVLNSGRPGKGIVLKVRITCGTWRLIFVNLLSNLTKWKTRAKYNDDDPHTLHQLKLLNM